jgi:hypothetical protein
MRSKYFVALMSSQLLLLLLFMPVVSSPILGSKSLEVFPPESKPYGLTYAEHAKNFWKWLLAIPAAESPMNDPSGDRCAVGQSNSNASVFYLSQGEGQPNRICKVPSGKGLFIPVMQVEWSDKEAPGASLEALHSSAKKDQDSVNSLYLNVDGKEYPYDYLLKYRTHTDDFEVVWPDKGIFGVMEGGPSKAVADGFYLITDPVAKGNHTVHLKSSLICLDPDCADPNYVQDVKYLIVAE